VFVVPLPDGRRLELGPSTRVMGILNVTPDSFSDGGQFDDPEVAFRHAIRMIEDGADVVDVGGESTRPGAGSVDIDEETRRVVPVIDRIRRETEAIVSVDTVKPEVAVAALEAGADIVNDVTGLRDPRMASAAAAAGAPVVVMHMRGTPRTMQADTHYDDLMGEIAGFLRETVEKAVEAGISGDKILLDPGIGFGKSRAGNLEILRRLPSLGDLGKPLLVGASRKSFIGKTLDLPVTDRLDGSLAVGALVAWMGAHVVRVHDVAETVRAVRMIDAIRNS
jgi:dihydropteroate synthase